MRPHWDNQFRETTTEKNQRLRAKRMKCKHCGGLISVRNPRGDCDHLYWPDNLTAEAKAANKLK